MLTPPLFSSRHRRFLVACVLLIALLAIALPAHGQSHLLRVIAYWDPLVGDPVAHPARVNVSRSYMTDTCYVHAGSPSGPSRIYSRPDTADVWPYCYIGQTGEFLVSIPDTVDNNIRVRLYMGPEALPDTIVIDWQDVNTTVRCTLEQFVDMADSGWHCIDPWVHLTDADYDAYDIDREDVRAVMEAEGLDAMNCLDATWDDETFAYARDNDATLWNKHGLAVWFQSQVQDGVWGYVLPMRTSASPTVDGALTAHMGQRSPGFMAERWYDRVDSLSGFSILAGGHRVRGLADTTTANGARRVSRDLWFSPFDATLTNPDAFLLCEPLMGCPVDEADRVAGAPNARSYASWRNVMAATGDILPAVGGSNASLNRWLGRAAAGSWRTYVMKAEGLPASWYPVALSRGHSYVTNGPLITYAKLDGKDLGTTLLCDPGEVLTLTIGIHSPHAVDSLRVWLNGSIYSAENLAKGVTDTTYTTDITMYGGADSRLWFDLVAKNDDDYLNWTEAQSDNRLYAISNPWFIDMTRRSLRQERAYTVYTDAKLDTINTLYVTTLDSWPDKHTTKSSTDSLDFATSYAGATDITEERFQWVRTAGRTLQNGTSEFPEDDYRTMWATTAVTGDTVYHYPGYYTRGATVTLSTANIVYRGFPEISRPTQVAFNMTTTTTPFITDSGADDITFRWMCLRNATALADATAAVYLTAVENWTFDNLWVKDFDCANTFNNGVFKIDGVTGTLTIRDCVFDSLDGGQYFLTQITNVEELEWIRNRVTRVVYHEDSGNQFKDIDLMHMYDSVWAQVDGNGGRGIGPNIYSPDGRCRIVGCTFYDCEAHEAIDQDEGVIWNIGADCDDYVSVLHCVFANCDSTDAIGFTSATVVDSLAYSLGFDMTDWPPAATDTVGLVGTDPHFALTRLDRTRTLRPTDTRTMELATGVVYMGWTEARPPSPTPTLMSNPFGSSVGGGGGGGGDPPGKDPFVSEIPAGD